MSHIRRLLILTGAGVSAESGLSTFRDAKGLWENYSFRDVATPEAFSENPSLVHGFYNARREQLKTVQPNMAHNALARLGRELLKRDREMILVTQNVDDLHERAGSNNVLKMHGALREVRCGPGPDGVSGCGAVIPWSEDLSLQTVCPKCNAVGTMRPNVVWFGEMPFHLDEIYDALATADMFVSIGTSGSVYPAAGFVHQARAWGIPCTELNLEPSENADVFTNARYGPAAVIVPNWVDDILAQ
ncbi:MAG: NAD-dependent deacylase [Pseudomonadota bacterium]